MMNRAAQTFWRRVLLLLSLLGTLACAFTLPDTDIMPAPNNGEINPESDEPATESVDDLSITLVAPLENAVYLEGVGVNFVARVTGASNSVNRVEVLIDNQIVATNPQPNPADAPAFTVTQRWTASGIGQHSVSMVVFRADGTSVTSNIHSIEVVNSLDLVQIMMPPEQNTSTSSPTESETNTEDAPAAGRAGLLGLLGQISGDSASSAPDPAPPDEGQSPTESVADPEPEPIEEDESPTDDTEASELESEPESSSEEEQEEPPSAPTTPTATLLVGANVRGGPSTEFGVIGGFAEGTETEALAVTSSGDWYKVRYYNGEGWISSQLLSVTGVEGLPIDDGPLPPTPVPTNPPPPTAEPTNRNIVFDGGITVDPFPLTCATESTVSFTVRNDGSEALGSESSIAIRDIHVASGSIIENRITLGNLGAGEQADFEVQLRVDIYFNEGHRIEVILDADNQVSESNEDDNRSSTDEYTLEQGGNC